MSSVALSRSLFLASRVCSLLRTGVSMGPALARICEGLPTEERAATQSVSYAAIRHYFLADALIRRIADQLPQPSVYALLLVALGQLLDTPEKSYVIVNEAVQAARLGRNTEKAGGFINACLRNFGRKRDSLLHSCLRQPEARCNAPRWWIRCLDERVGVEESTRIFLLQQTKAPLVLRVNRRLTNPQDWCKKAQELGVAALPIGQDGVVLKDALPVTHIPGFAAGEVSVQDAGAQLAARFLAPSKGERILDACAAPGGKTAHLLELADVQVTALEIDPQRAVRIGENLKRLGLTAKVLTADAAKPKSWWDNTPFDSILVDAPCTASGIVRRHPDVVISRRMSDIQTLAAQQKKILEALWPLVRVGGKLLYVVCSIFKEEGPEQIANFLQRHPEAETMELPGLQPRFEISLYPTDTSADEGILPQVHDGFYYALLTKKSS